MQARGLGFFQKVGGPTSALNSYFVSLHYFHEVNMTSKGQIAIPLRLREKFHLHAGDQLEFDEDAPILTARRAVNEAEWKGAFTDWQKACVGALDGHPWKEKTSRTIIDDLRGGPADTTQSEPPRLV